MLYDCDPMKDREIKLDPKSADYRQKEALVADIQDVSSLAPLGVRLSNLGRVLTANQLLSNKQRGLLLSGLNDSGLLHYHQDYFAEADRLENEGKKAPEVDSVQWFVEGNDRLQALAVESTYRLAGLTSKKERIVILIALLNHAHLETKKQFSNIRDSNFDAGISIIDAAEEQLLTEREPLGRSLVEQGDTDCGSIEEILEMQLTEFRQSELYDRFLIEFLYGDFSEDDPLKIFAALQKVMQLGFAMGIRDAREIKEREDEEWQ